MKNSPSLSEADAKKVAGELAKVLGDTYTIYLKTHGFHWNVEGPNFHDLHIMLEVQYTKLWEALDVLAERMRALGHYAPGSNSDMVKLSALEEEKGVPTAPAMLRQLIDDHNTVCNRLKAAHEVADELEDSGTTSLLEERLIEHQEFAWMLRAQSKTISGDRVLESVTGQFK